MEIASYCVVYHETPFVNEQIRKARFIELKAGLLQCCILAFFWALCVAYLFLKFPSSDCIILGLFILQAAIEPMDIREKVDAEVGRS